MGEVDNEGEEALTTPDWNSLVEGIAEVGGKLIVFVLSSWLASVAFNYLRITDLFIAWEDAIIIGFLLRWIAIRLRIGA